ncbi:MAG: arginine deiminase family protein [Bacteroidales bacterium]
MSSKINVNVKSEFGELEAVIIHTPGVEVEKMTPQNAQRALYSDILNLDILKWEHAQVSGVLKKVSKAFEVKDLLKKVLENKKTKELLIKNICKSEGLEHIEEELLDTPATQLADYLIEGKEMSPDSFTNFISEERFQLYPLYNFYFTRDASLSVYNEVFIGKMANKIRERESLIMEAIFSHSGVFQASTLNPAWYDTKNEIKIEGGDVLVAREDILLIGSSTRTSTQGIDFILSRLMALKEKGTQHVLVQELPEHPESFIHLDMVFTLIDNGYCVVFDPIILQRNKYRTIHIVIDNGRIKSMNYIDNLVVALKNLGMDLKPLYCGGRGDEWVKEREQWHSGANFFAFAPGKVMGYARNLYTLEELNNHGFEIVPAFDVMNNKVNINEYKKCVVSIEGSEMPRGGGGARCMTMPVRRKS